MERSITLVNNIAELRRLNRFIEDIGDAYNLDAELRFNLNLVLEEAVVNVINYAYTEGTQGAIDLTATLDGDSIVLVLADSGKPFDPTQVADADITLSAEERPIGGLGIFLIRQIMSDVRYERLDNRNILRLEKRLK